MIRKIVNFFKIKIFKYKKCYQDPDGLSDLTYDEFVERFTDGSKIEEYNDGLGNLTFEDLIQAMEDEARCLYGTFED